VIAFRAAQHTNADADVHAAAYQSGDTWLRESLGQVYDILDGERAASLLADPDRAVRTQIACSTHDPNVLARLADDPDWQIRMSASRNAATQGDLLERLATDPRKEVRASIAMRGDVTDSVVNALARDRSADVRWTVTVSQSRRTDLMLELAGDSDPIVASHAQEALRGGPDMSTWG
jgi:hypothetical protein